jgi:phospholipase C
MENRSFDHMMGWFPNADGKQAGLTYLDKSGNPQSTHRLAPDWTGCGHPDPDHSYTGARLEYDNGLMDGFLKPASNDLYSIGYYVEQDITVLAALARNFTLCDRFFPSMLGPTFPNRIFSHSGQSDRTDNTLALVNLPTIWDNLKTAGVSHKYYYSNLPFLALWGLKYLDISFAFSVFLSDCLAGTLPSVSFLDPKFTLLLNFADDDHPHSDIRNGEAFLSQVYRAVASSPNWPNTVLVINRDEWGGFFDHVKPPRALAPNNIDPDLVNGKALLGCRVPVIVVSPWTVGGPNNPAVNHTVFDHTSVLKLIESVFNVPPLAARETSNDVGNLLSLIDLNKPPQPAPGIPTANYVFPQRVCASSITPGIGASGSAFQDLLDSGLLTGWPIHL